MSFVFKTLDPSHITVTPFYANKLWTVGSVSTDLAGNSDAFVATTISMSGYYGRYHTSSWVMSGSEQLTRHGEYVRNIWNSAYNLFYKDFQHAPFEYYKQGNVGIETRNITEHIKVLSIPQQIIGQGIKPGTFKIVHGTSTLIDDGNGNLIMSNTSYGLNNSIYNESLKDFYYASFMYYDAVHQSKFITDTGSAATRITFNIKSHGNLGAVANFNLNSASGICAPVHSPRYLQGTVYNTVVKNSALDNPYILDMMPYSFTGSSYVRIPHSNLINFDTNDSFSVSIWVSASAVTAGGTAQVAGNANGARFVIGKRGLKKIRTAPWANTSGQLDPNNTSLNSIQAGGDYLQDVVELAPYPFQIDIIDAGYVGAGKIKFSRSDGARIDFVTSSGALSAGWNLVTCRNSGSLMSVSIGTTHTPAVSSSCLHTTTNMSDLFVGCRGDLITTGIVTNGSGIPSDGTTQYYGSVGGFNIWDSYISDTDISRLSSATSDVNFGPYNNHIGNIIYNQGLVILNAPKNFRNTTPLGLKSALTFDSLQFRSTKLINTVEAICVSGPGELNMTTNPSILVRKSGTCNPGIGSSEPGNYNEDGECYSFVTGSDFSPFVTTVGLYNDAGELLVVGKLATPIKKAQNCDTIFILKWDM